MINENFLNSISAHTLLQTYLLNRFGILLQDSKKEILLNTLQKRIQGFNILALNEYFITLATNAEELNFLINFITNKTTSFFRENHHFIFLEDYLRKLLRTKNEIKLWSAGCSTGEEPYSIAMIILEYLKHLEKKDIKILATDINAQALEIAKTGIYTIEDINQLTPMQHWFHPISSALPLKYQIDNRLKNLIRFRNLNLFDPWPIKGQFDVVFFRNVSIYITPEANLALLKRIDRHVTKGGIIMIGHSESLNALDNYLPLGKSIYQKKYD